MSINKNTLAPVLSLLGVDASSMTTKQMLSALESGVKALVEKQNITAEVPVSENEIIPSDVFLGQINFQNAVGQDFLNALHVERVKRGNRLVIEVTIGYEFWKNQSNSCKLFMADISTAIKADKTLFQKWERRGGQGVLVFWKRSN